MKKILFLLSILSIMSCKKKDDSSSTPMISNPIKYAITITANSSSQEYDFTVNSDKRFTCDGNIADESGGQFFKYFTFNSITGHDFVFTGGSSASISAANGDLTLKISHFTTGDILYEHAYTNGFYYEFTPNN